jgi:phenylalanyl-tRNA synthetase beta chain
VLTGRREPPHWSGSGNDLIDRWDLKGCFEAAVALAVPGGAVQLEGDHWIARNSQGEIVGEARPLEGDAPPWAAPLFGFELQLDPSTREPVRYAPLPTTPASERVFALLLGPKNSAAQAEELLRKAGGPLLESVSVESDYRGPELPSGSRSVAFRLTFRAPDRTLRDSEIDGVEQRMLDALAEQGIKRRDAASHGPGEPT